MSLDLAHRQARMASLHFYKSRGFRHQTSEDEGTVVLRLAGSDGTGTDMETDSAMLTAAARSVERRILGA